MEENDLKIKNQFLVEKEIRYFDHYFEGLIDEDDVLFEKIEPKNVELEPSKPLRNLDKYFPDKSP